MIKIIALIGVIVATIATSLAGGELVPIPHGDVQIYRRYYATPIRDSLFGKYRIGVQSQPRMEPIPDACLPFHIVSLNSVTPSEANEASRLSHAVCRVSVSGGAGSGTLIAQDARRGVVLTAKHVVGRESMATCKFRNGESRNGSVYASSDSTDAAIVVIPAVAGVKPILIAKSDPPTGSRCLALGYGGGWSKLYIAATNFVGLQGHPARFSTEPAVFISGDSGGTLMHNGKLVGVIQGYSLDPYTGRKLEGHGPNVTSIRQFLAQWYPDCCPPQQRAYPRGPQQRPDRLPVPDVPIDPEPTEPKPEPIAIDYDKLLDLIAADERFKPKDGKDGEPGPQGPPGQDGANGTDGASVSIEQVREMVREEMPEVNLDEVAKQVEQRLPPIYIPNQDNDGNVVRRKIRLGDELPPLHIRKGIKNPDGSYGEIVSETPVYLGEAATFWYFPSEEQKLRKE